MTYKTPTSGADIGLPAIERVEAIRARMAAFCDRFEVESVKLKTRSGQVYMTDTLLEWFQTSGASIDWILLGDPMPLAGAYRAKHLDGKRMRDVLRKFDDEECKLLTEALKGFEAAVQARRERIKAEPVAAGEAA
jgi:hypothetical protein